MRTTAIPAMALAGLLCAPAGAAEKATASGQLRITLQLPVALVRSEVAGTRRLCLVRIPARHYSLEIVRPEGIAAGGEAAKQFDGCFTIAPGPEPAAVTVIAE